MKGLIEGLDCILGGLLRNKAGLLMKPPLGRPSGLLQVPFRLRHPVPTTLYHFSVHIVSGNPITYHPITSYDSPITPRRATQ